MVMVVLPDPFQGMGAWKNSTETQHLGHAPRSGPEVKNGRSSAKDGTPERLRCGTIQEEVSYILQRVSAGAARRILLFVSLLLENRTAMSWLFSLLGREITFLMLLKSYSYMVLVQ